MAELLLILHDSKSCTGTTWEWCTQRAITKQIVLASHLAKHSKNLNFRGAIFFGGDMETNQTIRYPWLSKEKKFISKLITNKKHIFGLCLGAQLIAEQLQGKINHSKKWELGWYNVEQSHKSASEDLLTPLHWHSSTFDLPPGCHKLAENKFWAVQGFHLANKVVGYQFHAEINQRRLNHAIKGYRKGLNGSVQTAEEIQSTAAQYMDILKNWYFSKLDEWWYS